MGSSFHDRMVNLVFSRIFMRFLLTIVILLIFEEITFKIIKKENHLIFTVNCNISRK